MKYSAKLERLHSGLKNMDDKKISWSMGGDDIAVDRRNAKTVEDSSSI